MPTVDIADDTFVVAPPDVLVRWLAQPGRWRDWWPDLAVSVAEDRGPKGLRWSVGGPFVGTAEVWLQPWADGTLVHYYLRLDPPQPVTARVGATLRRRYGRAWRASVREAKDALERDRLPGLPSPPGAAPDR